MRTPDYFGNIDRTLDKAADVLDKSGLAYFVAIGEKDKRKPYGYTHGKIGDTHYSYELVMKATVAALEKYSKDRQVDWLKFIGKKLGYRIEVIDENV